VLAQNLDRKLCALLLGACALASCTRSPPLACEAGPPAPPHTQRPRIDGRSAPVKTILSNGLTVLIQESHSAPVVALQAWVKVGSADEGPGERGLAHVHEHMLFKGTQRRGVGEIGAAVEAAGGEINAWTSYDETVFDLVLASRFLDQGLDILADALLHSSFEESALRAELEVVVDEIRRSRDLPERSLTEHLFTTAYQQHPYRHPIIGSVRSVQALTRQQVLDFYQRWYRPSNMVLVLAGDLDPKRALRRVEELFAEAPEGAAPPQRRPEEPAQRSLRAHIAWDPVSESHLALGFPIPRLQHEDVPAIDLLAVLLAQGESSRLEQEVRRRRALATDVYAYAYTPRDAGLLVVGGSTPPERSERALVALTEETLRLTREPVSEAELERARQVLRTEVVYQKETVEGTARKLGYYEAVAGDLGYEARYHERLARLDPKTLLAVAQRYLRAERMSVAMLLPRRPGEEPPEELADLDLARVAALVAEAEAKLSQRFHSPALPPAQRGVHRVRLDNGLTLLIQPDPSVPLVALRAVFLGGLRAEQDAQQGIENLLARLLTRGTASRSAEQLAQRFDEMGGELAGVSGRNTLGLKAEVLSEHFTPALELLADCLLHPAFPQAEVARERSLVLEEIQARDDNLASLAFRAFAQELFGQHPYRFDPLGEQHTVAHIERDALERHYRRRYTPAQLTLAVVGDVDPAEVLRQVQRLLGGPSAPGQRPAALPDWPRPEAPRLAVRHMEREQAHLVLGFPGARLDAADRFALDLLATVLSGQGGRLFLELRERRAMAYSVGAVTQEGVEPGYFAIYLACAPDRIDEAIEAVLAQLALVRDEGITQAELRRAQEYLVGTQAIGLQRCSERAATLAFNELYGLGWDAHLAYPAEIMALDRDRIQEAARRHLALDRYTLAVVKPQAAPLRLLPGPSTSRAD